VSGAARGDARRPRIAGRICALANLLLPSARARAEKSARALSEGVLSALGSEYPQMLQFAGRWAALFVRGWDDIIYRQDDGRIRISLGAGRDA